jgi:hypothetical protein
MKTLLFFLVGYSAWIQAQQSPPPLAVPTTADVRSWTRTNTAGDIIITTIIPKPKPEWRHYYGIVNGPNARLEYLGEMTKEAYQVWANQGTTWGTGSGPQVQRWLCVIATTNRLEADLVHYRICP